MRELFERTLEQCGRNLIGEKDSLKGDGQVLKVGQATNGVGEGSRHVLAGEIAAKRMRKAC